MMRLLKLALLTTMLVSIVLAAPAQDPIDAALAKIGLTRQTARIDRDAMNIYGGDRYRLQLYDLFMDDPFKMPDYVPTFCRSALLNCNSLGSSVTFAALRVKAGTRRGLIEPVVTEYEAKLDSLHPLAHALSLLYDVAGAKQPRGGLAGLDLKPDSLNRQLALLVTACTQALKWRNLAFSQFSPAELKALYTSTIGYICGLDVDTTNEETARLVENAIGRVDYDYLNLGAIDIATVLDSVVPRLTRMNLPDSFRFRCPTPLGPIIINGRGNDTYNLMTNDEFRMTNGNRNSSLVDRHSAYPFIIIDLGGNDVYHNVASNRSPDNPISIVIDLGGNDRYVSTDKKSPSFGGGLLGYSFLIDVQGDDHYESQNLTQGAGAFGVGVLADESGNDTYDAYTAAQGGGAFGLGVLIDRNGNDKYHAYQQCQGYGYTKGCGVLIDSSGNDRYVADDSNIVFPSAQSKEHNSSLAQGMGFGKRADYVDNHSLAGGVGLLIDGSGDDTYSCGIFGQGCAYWYGVGVLADMSGNDNYSGIWYVQGAGAHFGVSMLYDASGNDSYKATMNMAQGAGHDFSLCWLLDGAGDDVYDAPNLSLGGGNANGFGFFWDQGGSDVFNPASGAVLTLGRASDDTPRGLGLRDYMTTLGVFLHTNAKSSTFPKERPFAKHGTIWTQAGPNEKEPLSTEKGVGLDW
jgi:hypothetical protein